jgi:hypothetical protein
MLINTDVQYQAALTPARCVEAPMEAIGSVIHIGMKEKVKQKFIRKNILMSQTTSVNITPEIKKLWNIFDRIILHKMQNKQPSLNLTLTSAQYYYYRSKIKEPDFTGNPFYRGLEIKRMGDA